MKHVAVIGGGYVGLCTAVALATHGHRVEIVDVLPARVEQIRRGEAPFYEPGLDEALRAQVAAGRVSATTNIAEAVGKAEFTFLCVGTPQGPDGAQDQSYLRKACEEVGAALKAHAGFHVVITKSTVVPGTARDVVRPTLERASGRTAGRDFGVASNPEFLKEGAAMHDALHPDRVVVGADDERTRAAVWTLYTQFSCPKIDATVATAETIKYAANAFLATKITFANEMANLCERIGVDWIDVVKGIGDDPRIGHQFLRAGIGFGGSCFPKDVAAINHLARKEGVPSALLASVLDVNERQPLTVVRMLEEELGTLRGKRVALLGLAFKPDTDDVRETRSLPVWRALHERGADIACHDPKGAANFLKLEPRARTVPTADDALRGADGVVICTEWREYADVPARTKAPVIDGRRITKGGAKRAVGRGGN